jgi:FdhD protein
MTDRPGVTTRVRARVVVDGLAQAREDVLATEEPLEIRLGDHRLAVTMRTPGADFELAAGFLFGERVVSEREHIRGIRYCLDPALDDEQRYNVVTVDLAPGLDPDLHGLERHFFTSSACGVCGRESIDSLRHHGCEPLGPGPVVDAAVVAGLPEQLRSAQRVFDRTGGLHAAGLFSADGQRLAVREGVGRHNAVDKLVGWAFLQDLTPLAGHVLAVSGRASYEIVQKAISARIPVVAAVSAPSSLAVALAKEYGVTLAAFVRDGRFTVYAGWERVRVTADESGRPSPSR